MQPIMNTQPQAPNPSQDNLEGSNASPEEQQQYDLFVSQVYQLIYGPHSGDLVEQAIQKATPDNIVMVLANTAAKSIISVEKSAKEGGADLPDDVVFHGGAEIVSDLVDYAAKMGKVTEQQHDDIINQVAFQTIKIYGDQALAEGLITPEQQAQAKEHMQQEMQGMGALTDNQQPPMANDTQGMANG